MSAQLNIAQQIAAKLRNDGQCFATADGVSLAELANETCGQEESATIRQSHLTRWVFPDESVILICERHWDFGFADCWCSESDGPHHPQHCTRLIEAEDKRLQGCLDEN